MAGNPSSGINGPLEQSARENELTMLESQQATNSQSTHGSGGSQSLCDYFLEEAQGDANVDAAPGSAELQQEAGAESKEAPPVPASLEQQLAQHGEEPGDAPQRKYPKDIAPPS